MCSLVTVGLGCNGIITKCNYLVSGFIRILDQTSGLLIPSEIIDICHMFFHTMDTFYEMIESHRIKIESNGGVCVHTNNGSWDTIFGSKIIDITSNSGSLTWIFKICGIYENQQTSDIQFGIAEDDKELMRTHWIAGSFLPNKKMYCFYSQPKKSSLYQIEKYCNKLVNKIGQKIFMTLNLKEKTLKFKIDGEDLPHAYTDIDNTRKYRMAVSFWGGINKLQLL
eukprot:456384_1